MSAVLLYHRVAEPVVDPHGLAVSPAMFREQMQHLRSEYRVVSLEELVRTTTGGDEDPRQVAVTFDDGYVDNLLCASPILLELGVPATFFLVAESIKSDYYFWWDRLAAAVLTAPQGRDTLPIALESERLDLPVRTPEERARTHQRLWETIFHGGAQTRNAVLAQLDRWWDGSVPVEAGARRMMESEMRQLASREGHSIGAHSVTHGRLTGQHPSVLEQEIVTSGLSLRETLDVPVAAFSYPFGQHDVPARAIVARHYSLGVTTEAARVPKGVDRLRVPRFVITPHLSATFNAWLQGVCSELQAS
jgi:peptidoglycan/xylan/chitin deacetylase (PgdA/CDA1 family)